MIYLYLKIHNKTGLKYLGQTKQNPYTYNGSGVYWQKHLKKHGINITTYILFVSESKQIITEKGLYYSKLWNIVESKEFANLIVESGEGQSKGFKHSKKTRKLLSEITSNQILTAERNEKISRALKGRSHPAEWRKKVSKALKGRTWSEEHRANSLDVINSKKKPIMYKEKRYDSVTDCAKINSVSRQSIYKHSSFYRI